jgi:PEP-CTERM motif
MRKSLKRLYPILFTVVLLVAPATSYADTLWTFSSDSIFTDGGLTTGSFTIQAGTGLVTSWDISTSAGSSFAGALYVPCLGGIGGCSTLGDYAVATPSYPSPSFCVSPCFEVVQIGSSPSGSLLTIWADVPMLPEVVTGEVVVPLCTLSAPCTNDTGFPFKTGETFGGGAVPFGFREFDPGSLIGTPAGGVSPVPEPTSIILLASGLAGLGAWRRRMLNRMLKN